MTGIEAIDQFAKRLKEGITALYVRIKGHRATAEEIARIRPFIVLCAPRTGSTHLLEMLRQHPAIEGYFEVFHDDIRTRDRVDGRPAQDHEDGRAFLFRLFGRERDPAIQAVGLKLMYRHGRKGKLATAWDFLLEEPRLVVFDLYRENLLQTLVSHRIAERTKVWQAPGRRGKKAGGQVHLSRHDCAHYFAQVRAERAAALEAFKDHSIVTIRYEDLIAREETELAKVWAALGLAPITPTAIKRKFEFMTMRERVANYDALQAFFAGTDDAIHFNEAPQSSPTN